MAVLDHTDKQKILSSTLLTTLLLAALLFSTLLVVTASRLSQSTGSITGSLGPVKLFEITKIALPGGGYSGGFRLLGTGLSIYLACWLITGLAVGIRRSQKMNS